MARKWLKVLTVLTILGLLAFLAGTAGAGGVPPAGKLSASREELDYYLFPEMELAEWSDGVYSQARLADFEAVVPYSSGLSWNLELVSGSAEAELNSWRGTASLVLTGLPESAGDCVWRISCTPDGGSSLAATVTVHFKEAPSGLALPEGWEQVAMTTDDGKWAADINEPIPINSIFRFKDEWSIPGFSVTAEDSWSSEEFQAHRSDLGANGFSMNASDVYAVEVILRCCNIEWAFTRRLYIRDGNGVLPEVKPAVSLKAYGMDVTRSRETRFYIADGLRIADPDTDKAFSLPGVLSCNMKNMEFFPEGLTWEMQRTSGNADVVLSTRNNGMNADLGMRTMPTSAGDSVFTVRCLYLGEEIWSKSCTVHVRQLTGALPAGNKRTGGNTAYGEWYADVGKDIPMSDIFDFTDEWRIPGETHLMVTMDSDDDAFWENVNCGEPLVWSMCLLSPGVYPVTVITSCYNVSWGHEYLLYVGQMPPYQRIDGDTLRIPAGVKEIGAESFRNTGAQVVIIPEGCETVEAYAFAGSPYLAEVEIPESVTSLDSTAFNDCDALRVFITRSEAAAALAEILGIRVVNE